MTSASNTPFGVVIPAYGHPKFLAEAIVSACEQDIDRPVYVVVVDDGCKFEETGDTVAHLLPKYEGRLFYLRQENTRLPGARNSGIKFLLNLLPELEAIYFLDADNRLAPHSLQVFWQALGDDPNIGWAYPDISFFGLTRGEEGFDTRETAPIYSPLRHLLGNISEAGSLVRADMCRAGVMFDETMTSGFEDWEFWLSALDAGFRGVRAQDTGFMYRGRPESMLADSRRLAAGLVEKIRTKHNSLFSAKNIMLLEHEEAPAFALYIPEDKHVLLVSDPLGEPAVITIAEFQKRFQAWAHHAVEHFFPDKILTVPKAVWKQLNQQPKYLRWFFWKLRETKNEALFIKLVNIGRAAFQTIAPDGEDFGADLFCVSSKSLWARAHSAKGPVPTASDAAASAFLSLPYRRGLEEGADKDQSRLVLRAVFEGLIAPCFPLPRFASHASKSFSGPFSHSVRESLIRDICAFENREPFPACTDMKRTIVAFKAALLSQAPAMEKIQKLLAELQTPGHETIVLLESEGDVQSVYLPHSDYGWVNFVECIVPFPLPGNELESSMYLGQRFQRELTVMAPNDLAIIARTADRMVVCGAGASLEALGEARLHGATGFIVLAPEFMGPEKATQLGLSKMLAFEHAVTQVATDDKAYETAMVAQGFPASKFVSESSFAASLQAAQ
ncbi:MAG: glycosyltransferase family 2 protein [Kordiimonadaceae bacterium]|nr:glycosyltransferase family 2 protein [Kordiimonadaceae bacterium]